MIGGDLPRPVANRVVRKPSSALCEFPAKYLQTLGGCEGLCRFTEGHIQYATEYEEAARERLLARDINSL